MSDAQDPKSAEEIEASLGPIKPTLPHRRPAELIQVLTGIVVLAAAVGLDVSYDVLVAGVVVLAGLPAIVTYFVDLYREALDE